jgi:hypothetical protein
MRSLLINDEEGKLLIPTEMIDEKKNNAKIKY